MNERLPHHELQLLLGAYVLGGLDAEDRRRLEEHLPECATCGAELSRFAGVPALLRLAPPAEPAAEPPTVSEDSLPRLIAAARTRRAAGVRRRWILAAAAVMLVLAGVTGGVLAAGRDPGPAPVAVVVASSGGTRVVGEAVLDPRVWGTEVRLTLDYKAYGKQPYTAWAVADDGREEQAASWTTPPGGKCAVTGATSIPRDQLARVEVRTADGKTVLRTP